VTVPFCNAILDVVCLKKPCYGNAASNKRMASSVFVFLFFFALWPVLPFRETKNFIRFGLNNCMVFTILQHKIIFSKSQLQVYSIEYMFFFCCCSLIKRKGVYLQNLTVHQLLLFTLSQNRCTCGNCQVLGRVEACICGEEIEALENKLVEAVTSGECEEQPQCITQHPGFHAVCINRWVLQVAWYQYKQQYKASYDGQEDKLFPHTAYRQLTQWCRGILGKEIRVVLPACGVMCIRNFYPPPGPEEDFVFEGFHYADE